MPYVIILKVRKFHQSTGSRFGTAGKKPVGGHSAPPSLNRVNPSYTKLIRTNTLYQGESSGPPISSTTWLYKPQILQGITDTIQGLRQHKVCKKKLLYGYHGNCLITWCFSIIIVKTSMKNRYFSNAPRNHELEGVKKKLCVMIVLFSKKVILK